MSWKVSPAVSLEARLSRCPPLFFFLISAIFHYLGPAFAVVLFQEVAPLGVAWLRIASAAAVFALFRKPWRVFRALNRRDQRRLIAFGVVLATMNSCFYLSISVLPLGTVGAIEFLGPIILAVSQFRTARNFASLGLAVAGVYFLTRIEIKHALIGYLFAFANCALFMLYVSIGHAVASSGAIAGADAIGSGMLVAMITIIPIGIRDAAVAFLNPVLLLAATGVGISSSVIPYVCDQLAMKRLPAASFSLLLSILPAMATAMGIVVLRQFPSRLQLAGLLLVVAGVALHRAEIKGVSRRRAEP
ncbi:MAG TPA: EamA family transporter [Chthoniobacterales bacterium]|nr:EamA family transporter [Chthoniobacterales bacterium]